MNEIAPHPWRLMQDDADKEIQLDVDSCTIDSIRRGGFSILFQNYIVALDPWFSPCDNSKMLALEIMDTVDSILDIIAIVGMELWS